MNGLTSGSRDENSFKAGNTFFILIPINVNCICKFFFFSLDFFANNDAFSTNAKAVCTNKYLLYKIFIFLYCYLFN